jgi:murein DD-endopeptidase MepM/ murein hydrolase activator NlpD
LNKVKKAIMAELLFLLFFIAILSCKNNITSIMTSQTKVTTQENPFSRRDTAPNKTKKEFIKWVDFNATTEALNTAYKYDVESYGKEVKLNWIELLAYAACKGGGDFNKTSIKRIKEAAEALTSKETTMAELTKELKNYSYYEEVYHAILDGFVGEYEIEEKVENSDTKKVWVKKYGLKAFFPIAKGFPNSGYDDFGVSRSYGYERNHLGHDMMGQTGSPIICVESGYIEALGWNQYGGWRIGIRSFDKKRYYYYAHLRQNFPFCKSLKLGDNVTAGDVIGYMGHTGYSTTENVNNIKTTHLHFGMQLIFDESQKECDNEIWIDCYALTNFLAKNKSEATKNEATKEWYRIYDMKDANENAN